MLARSDSLPVEVGALAGAEPSERAVGPRGVGPVEYPVLPGRQAAEDLGLHGFRAGEPVVGLQAGQGIGAEAGPLLDRDPDLLVPVNVVGGEGDQAEAFGLLGLQRLAG